MEALLNFISDEFLHFMNGEQTEDNRRRIKGTPYYVRMENLLLTPDSETPDSTDQEISPEEKSSKDVWTTPKQRRIQGVDFPRSRRINFDLAEDEEKEY